VNAATATRALAILVNVANAATVIHALAILAIAVNASLAAANNHEQL